MSELAAQHNANTERIIFINEKIAAMELAIRQERDLIENLLMENESLESDMSISDYQELV